MTRRALVPIFLAGLWAALLAETAAAAAERDACYLFQLAAVDSVGRIIHDNWTEGDAGPRVVEANSAIQFLDTAKCDVQAALTAMNCLMNEILPYKGDYTLQKAESCLDKTVGRD